MKNISSIEIPEQYDVATGDMIMRIASDVMEHQNLYGQISTVSNIR